MTYDGFPPNPPHKAGYRLEFAEEFDESSLNLSRWFPYYLPQWSSRERTAARHTLTDSTLVLYIDEQQEAWCPEFDGEVRCTSIQTGVYAGAVGSPYGQHRFKPSCVVREAQPTQRLYTPQYGFFEARVKAPPFAGSLGALWMIGFEEVPQESGEIVLFELFGDSITPSASEVRYGVHAWSDPTLQEEFFRETLPFNAAEFHIYGVEWTPTHIDFYIDNVHRQRVMQSPAYPMQFMLNIYDLPVANKHTADYPRRFVIDYVRGYQPEGGY